MENNIEPSIDEILKEANENYPKEYFNILRPGECDLLCSSGRCKADCCGCVSFPEKDFKKLKKFIPDDAEYYEYRFACDDVDHIKPMTANFKCVFLSKTNSCLIHDSALRPEYCKRFGEDRVQPLFACVHINQEMKAEIEEFARLYLESLAEENNAVIKAISESEKF